MEEKYFYLGKIVKPHGFKGDWLIYLDTDEPESYQNLNSIFVELEGTKVPFIIEAFRGLPKKNRFLMKLQNPPLPDRSIAGCSLYLPISLLPELRGNKFYYHEVFGFSVKDTNYGDLGIVKDVNDRSPQPILVVEFQNKEILIPIVDAFIKEVNKKSRCILVEVPEGLLDIF